MKFYQSDQFDLSINFGNQMMITQLIMDKNKKINPGTLSFENNRSFCIIIQAIGLTEIKSRISCFILL
jgi:hypothetical protein